MIPDFSRTYKGYKIDHYRCTGVWSITRPVSGKFFERVEYVAYSFSESSCIEYIDAILKES